MCLDESAIHVYGTQWDRPHTKSPEIECHELKLKSSQVDASSDQTPPSKGRWVWTPNSN